MNYLFKEMLRELECKKICIETEQIDTLESITDILVKFEDHMDLISGLGYDIYEDHCEIRAFFPELVIRTSDEAELYDVLELANRFEFTQEDELNELEEDEMKLILTVNI